MKPWAPATADFPRLAQASVRQRVVGFARRRECPRSPPSNPIPNPPTTPGKPSLSTLRHVAAGSLATATDKKSSIAPAVRPARRWGEWFSWFGVHQKTISANCDPPLAISMRVGVACGQSPAIGPPVGTLVSKPARSTRPGSSTDYLSPSRGSLRLIEIPLLGYKCLVVRGLDVGCCSTVYSLRMQDVIRTTG